MRRALGSNKIIVVDAEAPDAFTVVGTVTVSPVDERTVQLVIKWDRHGPPARPSATRTGQPGAGGRDQRLVGGLRRHRRDWWRREVCSSSWKRRSTAHVEIHVPPPLGEEHDNEIAKDPASP